MRKPAGSEVGVPATRHWDEYPTGTQAVAIGGGHWTKRADGWWQWFCGDAFPRPGADARWVRLPVEAEDA